LAVLTRWKVKKSEKKISRPAAKAAGFFMPFIVSIETMFA
jgi:hypothetical protein